MTRTINERIEAVCNEYQMNPVKIEQRLINRIGVREWGTPSMVMPGQIWRSELQGTISCMVPHATDPVLVTTETRLLQIIDVGQLSVMPDHWRDALWEYARHWPESGCKYGPFLKISSKERHEFLKQLGKQLVESTYPSCRMIADMIGEFAAFPFEIVSDPEQALTKSFYTNTGSKS